PQQRQQPPLQPPTRIKSFLRQNQYNTGTKIFLPLFYLVVTIIYFHSLLFQNVESSSLSSGGSGGGGGWQQPHAQLYHGKDDHANTNDSSSLSQKGDTVMLLEPRSLAHVAITNAEIAWRRHVDRENYLRRQAERREERAKEWLRKKQQAQEQEDEEKERVLLRGRGSHDTTLTKHNQSSNNSTSTATDTDTEDELEAASDHLKNLVSGTNGSLMSALAGVAGAGASKRKVPTSSTGMGGRRSINGQIDNNSSHQRTSSSTPGFLPLLLIMFTCSMLRVCVQVLVHQEHAVGIGLDSLANDSDDDNDDNNATTTSRRRRRSRRVREEEGSGGMLSVAARLRRRAQISHAQRQFQNFANRLNAERAANGERQISVDTLRHLVHARDFNSNDYDRLSNFVEENGPAMGSFFSAIGATDAEINRCPSRVLEANDELLRLRMSTSSSRRRSSSSSSGGSSRHGMGDPSLQQQEQQTMHSSSCAVCLEQYQVGETLRTIPCFHTFHASCIDPWLAQRAECPVCKHSAIG
ncbi:hypothetical protein ACHAXH_005005, partial [Discostella pseudostelligera]